MSEDYIDDLYEDDDYDDYDVCDYCDGMGCDECDLAENNFEDENDMSEFQDPGGNSALRAATKNNPRNLPCPTCEKPNRLTPKDVSLHYQCNRCADRDEGIGY